MLCCSLAPVSLPPALLSQTLAAARGPIKWSKLVQRWSGSITFIWVPHIPAPCYVKWFGDNLLTVLMGLGRERRIHIRTMLGTTPGPRRARQRGQFRTKHTPLLTRRRQPGRQCTRSFSDLIVYTLLTPVFCFSIDSKRLLDTDYVPATGKAFCII